MLQLSKKIIGLLLCLTVSIGSAAQQKVPEAPLPDHCASSRVMLELYKQHPATKIAAGNQEANIKKFIANLRQQRVAQTAQPVQYTIPVVFHINDPVNPYKVTIEQIRSAMEILNQDYNLQNADYSQIDPRFIGLAANLHITFRLADIDPQGNPTNGVTYHYNDLDGRSPDGSGAAVKSISWWPCEKYLNIWIVSEVEQKGVFNNSGWTYLPDNWVADNHLDGVMYNWRYLGAPGVGCSENGYPNMKRVLTHEVGHYLNLWHTFENGCNAPGDYIDDTPPTQSNFGGCNLSANWCGVVANVENYMDYSSCTKMFTNGQKDRMMAALNDTVAHRSNLWSAANLAATLLSNLSKRIVPGFSIFTESDANDGSVTVTDTLRMMGGAKFAFSSGYMTQGSHFTVQNLPAGLGTVIQVVNDTTAVLSFNGKATQNNVVDNTDNIKLTFLDAAVQGGVSTLYRSGLITLGIHFVDPYKIVYGNLPNIVVNTSSTWTYFSFGVGDATFGGWFDNGKLRLETYKKAAVCEGVTHNISPLVANTIIGGNSSFVNGGDYPDELDIYSNAYTKWAGQTGFIGVKFSINGKPRYGWIRITVAADGSSYTIKDYAWNEAPNGSIAAGDAGSSTLSWSASQVYEAKANDGSITDTVEVAALGSTFAISSGNFTPGVHYTVSNLPAGLGVQLTALNNTTAHLTFTGKASSNNVADNTSFTVNLLPAAFSNNQTVDNANKQISINFRDPYKIKYVKVNDTVFTVNPTHTWFYFLVDSINDANYGLWADTGKLRLETYNKPMVCKGNTRNIALLPANTNISDTSNFVPGAPFPDEHILSNAAYTVWKGQTGYAGFTFTTRGDTYYGWFRFKVSPSGLGYTLMDYAYNTLPGGSIRAGQMTEPVDSAVNAQDYCPASTLLNYNSITRVRLANLDNSSQWDGYRDFTAQSATVTAGQSYQLEINLGIESWPDISVAAWVDWNGDKQLDDATEKIFVKRGSGPFKQTITVPANAKTGSTLLRVRMGYGSNVTPCGIDNYQGEVEDYTVKVTAGTALQEKPLLAATSLTATSPFTDRINISYQSTVEGPVMVRLYNLNGAMMKQQTGHVTKGANALQLNNLSALLPGFYVIDISHGIKHYSVKVVK
ncbi:putative secreted protein (Por secretion system target) [Chitinophaga niastensis]|uniref:Putative secreted protein (Por secretion system target) n=1 Tax=Chitinophaga niastensis TaxID=536980 RepID=A0A2P8HA52_CHINA|nr:M43 family zinc metalloprotease [Chitinophaga niastensis]PSL43070.1 putative secreted protein (Por secretion system target) [Chitinophaga niastensis]